MLRFFFRLDSHKCILYGILTNEKCFSIRIFHEKSLNTFHYHSMRNKSAYEHLSVWVIERLLQHMSCPWFRYMEHLLQ